MITVYSAPWIIPIDADIIQSGAVAVKNQTILDVGKSKDILVKYHDCHEVRLNGVLLPFLINCHIHLELSHIKGITQPTPETPMSAWISELVEIRSQKDNDTNFIVDEIEKMVEYQFNTGVGFLVNIGNSPEHLPQFDGSIPEVYSIYEVLAPTSPRTTRVLNEVQRLSDELPVSPHAVYSSSAKLIKELKNRASIYNHLFSIHAAESADENYLVQTQNGSFREFLHDRNCWDNTLMPADRFNSVIEYLDSLEVFDENTLCIHGVHASDSDIAILKKRKAHICCCPGSNDFLRVGEPPVQKMLKAGILPCIGTDSPASNIEVNMWREMQFIRRQNSEIDSLDILKMATLGGASAVQRSNDYGSLTKGKKAQMLEIQFENLESLSANEILDKLTSDGQPERLRWILPMEN